MNIDVIDRRILDMIQKDGKVSQSQIAQTVGLTTPSVNERIKKMEKRGIIKGYAALLDQSKLGVGLTAFIDVTLENARCEEVFISEIEKLLEVQECHHMSGDCDYRLKVKAVSPAELEGFLRRKIHTIKGVSKIKVEISLSVAKESPTLFIPQDR
jgi:Lrp/AsnC family transcriptional regulator, leucine-responsive regulatory protein